MDFYIPYVIDMVASNKMLAQLNKYLKLILHLFI